jgi:hypothetical protein
MDTRGKAAQAAENWAMGNGRGKGGKLMDGFRYGHILDDGLRLFMTAKAPADLAPPDLSSQIGLQPNRHLRKQLSK